MRWGHHCLNIDICYQIIKFQRNKNGSTKAVLSTQERLQIISIWENQTTNRPVTKRAIGRMYGVSEGAIRLLLKRKSYWKTYVGLDGELTVPKNFDLAEHLSQNPHARVQGLHVKPNDPSLNFPSILSGSENLDNSSLDFRIERNLI